jgi:carbamoyltransferase
MIGDGKIVGLNQFGHHSSVSIIDPRRPPANSVIYLGERFTRKKYQAGVNYDTLVKVRDKLGKTPFRVAESSYFVPPSFIEEAMTLEIPYLEKLQALRLSAFTSLLNPDVRFITHHLSHAHAANAMNPFQKSILVVIDGAGNKLRAFSKDHPELLAFPPSRYGFGKNPVAETCTVYLQKGHQLTCVHKEWSYFRYRRLAGEAALVTDALGNFYENSARYIFGSPFEAGKVMGLAPFGKPKRIRDRGKYILELNWKEAGSFDQASRLKRNQTIAASVQNEYESGLSDLLRRLREQFPDYEDLILTGGSALNCVANEKILRSKMFSRIYVPPFPSDECIAFGAAHALANERKSSRPFRLVDWRDQTAALGDPESSPRMAQVRALFRDDRCEYVRDPKVLTKKVAQHLAQGKVLGWFQGRSEVGPRALGNRSILADPGNAEMQNYLNQVIKKRESFRPFGVSCTWEQASEYFHFPKGADSAFMSFAPQIREKYCSALSSVRHVDGSSRIQTVRREQDPLFHMLLKQFAQLSGVACLLNTSLNVAGEPLVETVDDALRLFRNTPIDGIVVGKVLVMRK